MVRVQKFKMVTKEEILAKLKTILDPELKINVVDLGLIYEISLDSQSNVEILMTLTTPFCPLSAFFEKELMSAVKKVKDIKDVKINLTFDPPWDASKMSEEARLQLGL